MQIAILILPQVVQTLKERLQSTLLNELHPLNYFDGDVSEKKAKLAKCCVCQIKCSLVAIARIRAEIGSKPNKTLNESQATSSSQGTPEMRILTENQLRSGEERENLE